MASPADPTGPGTLPFPTLVRLPRLDVAAPTIHDGALESTVAPASPARMDMAPLDDPDFAARYELSAQLGEGGMGVVRLAVDRRIGREVAVKTMLAGHGLRADHEVRFVREACVQGQLEHPGIVPVHDVGRDPDGALYFSMKRVRGATFDDIVRRLRAGDPDAQRTHSRRKLLGAFGSVCQAVHFAHTRGVVHRDLKPANVMLGDFGEVYVLDWGVAKLVATADASSGERPSIVAGGEVHTLVGHTIGTPGYLSPEQATGDAAVDARSDVYALGAILFELLAFEPLHPTSSVEAALVSTMRGADARPSARAPHLELPPELDAICVRATALRPEERFANVRELIDAVERFLDGDRDQERRARLAAEHALAAAMSAEQALAAEGTEASEARSRALRDVGRALALDPSNAEAMRTFVSLLTVPPRELPREAEEEMSAAARARLQGTARGALLGYGAWLLFIPFALWMGVRSPIATAVATLLWAAAAGFAYVSLRRPDARGRPGWGGLVATAAAAGATCTVCGPYVLVPTLAVINVILWLLVSESARRGAILALGGATILVPALLDFTGLAHFYNFRDGRVTILQGMLDFPPVATHAFFLAVSLALVGIAAVLVTRFRDNLTDAERRLHLQAWQLGQLVSRPAGHGNNVMRSSSESAS